jgi:hypothetical protein
VMLQGQLGFLIGPSLDSDCGKWLGTVKIQIGAGIKGRLHVNWLIGKYLFVEEYGCGLVGSYPLAMKASGYRCPLIDQEGQPMDHRSPLIDQGSWTDYGSQLN